MSDENKWHSEQLRELVANADWEALRRRIGDLDPADLADFLEEQDPETRDAIFATLDNEAASDVLVEMEDPFVDDIVEDLPADRIAGLAAEMAPDDAAEFLDNLEPEQSQAALAALAPEVSSDIRRILEHEEDTAGRIMTPELFSMRPGDTVAKAKAVLAGLEHDDPIMYVYLTDADGRLKGLVPFQRLLQAAPETVLDAIAETDYVFASQHEDREDIAVKFRKYDIWVMPVVDAEHRLVGRITVDDIMDVVQEEADEDLAHLVGAPDIEDDGASAVHSARMRFPWLLITMFAGMVIGLILKNLLHQVGVGTVAVFVPMVLAMGGNTGMQASAIAVRGIALGEKKYKRLFVIVRREIFIGVLLGLVCGLICGGTVWLLLRIFGAVANPEVAPATMGLIVGLSMCNAMAFAASYGALVPVVLHRLGVDPAVASGPFVTTSNDLSAALIYFATCLLLLKVGL